MNEENPYKTPESVLATPAAGDPLNDLRWGSTWLLVLLVVVTYGVYSAHYAAHASGILNRQLPEDARIGDTFVYTIYALCYVSLGLFLVYLTTPEGHPIEPVLNIFDFLSGVMVLIWGFVARNRIHRLRGTVHGERDWFHGLGTFLLTPLYMNWKINVLTERASPPDTV